MRYTLMHKDIAVAIVTLDEVTGGISKISEVFNAEHFPLGAAKTGEQPTVKALNAWWFGRAIPASRSGLRDLLSVLGVATSQLLLAKCLGLSLSDQYWVRPQNSNATWADVNFFDNNFSDDVGSAMFGRYTSNNPPDLMSPDNTSDGWLKKRWIISDGKRLLMKGGSAPLYQEPLNELFATAVLKRLDVVPFAEYTLGWDGDRPVSLCENFITPQTELVAASYVNRTLVKDASTSPYAHYLVCCEKLGIADARLRTDQMLALDYLIAGTDRHFGNFGIVRNADTLEPLSVAPIFDCGTSMWHDTVTHRIRPRDMVSSKPFRSSHDDQIKLVESLDWLDTTALRGIEDECREILRASVYIDDARRDLLCNALKTRHEMLAKIQQDMGRTQIQGITMCD